jgi:hypothetical protein
VGQFDLHSRAQSGVGPLDLIQRRRARHAAEAEPRDLVVRRARLGEARHATGNGYHKAGTLCPATVRCLAGLGDELRLRPLDAPGHGGVTEQRQSVGIHAQSLAKISPSVAVADRGPVQSGVQQQDQPGEQWQDEEENLPSFGTRTQRPEPAPERPIRLGAISHTDWPEPAPDRCQRRLNFDPLAASAPGSVFTCRRQSADLALWPRPAIVTQRD